MYQGHFVRIFQGCTLYIVQYSVSEKKTKFKNKIVEFMNYLDHCSTKKTLGWSLEFKLYRHKSDKAKLEVSLNDDYNLVEVVK